MPSSCRGDMRPVWLRREERSEPREASRLKYCVAWECEGVTRGGCWEAGLEERREELESWR